MIVIPAIDIRGGRCVRLIQGDYNREHVYESDPAVVARRLVESGAHRIHLVDLDAARGTADVDSAAAAGGVLEAAREGGVEIEVGGGVRTLAAAERWLAAGATFVVLGSVAVCEPDAAEAICAALPGRCLASLDVRGDVAQAEVAKVKVYVLTTSATKSAGKWVAAGAADAGMAELVITLALFGVL